MVLMFQYYMIVGLMVLMLIWTTGWGPPVMLVGL